MRQAGRLAERPHTASAIVTGVATADSTNSGRPAAARGATSRSTTQEVASRPAASTIAPSSSTHSPAK